MAGRIRELREISGFSAQTMALKTGTSEEEYLRCEAGQSDLNFAFLYRCALVLALTLQISSRAAAQSFDPIR